MEWTGSSTVGLGVGVLLLLSVGACGGSGGGGDTPNPNVRAGRSTSVAALDGWVRSDGAWDATFVPRAGDLDQILPGQRILACYTFNIGAMAPGTQIVTATLSVDVTSSLGDPYAEHGDMEASYLPYGDSLGNALVTTVFDPPVAAFSPSTTAPGTKQADVRTLLQRAIDDGNGRLQVQVGFLRTFTLVNGLNDLVLLTDGENTGGGEPPTLAYQWIEP